MRKDFFMKQRMAKKIMILGLASTMLFGGTAVSAMTKTPYADKVTGIHLRVYAWFNSGYKTTDDDKEYKVKPGRYIKRCWVRFEEGNYDKKKFSKSYTKKQEKTGKAELKKYNNPFAKAKLTWGWKYNK